MTDKLVTIALLFNFTALILGLINMLMNIIPAFIPYMIIIASFIYSVIIYIKFRNDSDSRKPALGSLIISSLVLLAFVIVPIIVGIWFVSTTSDFTITYAGSN